jgi:hypothetical protein
MSVCQLTEAGGWGGSGGWEFNCACFPPLKVHKHEILFVNFLQKPKTYGPKGL